MAAIDKIYGTVDQYDEFHDWIKKNRRQYLKFFYPWKRGEQEYREITNFPQYADAWLLLHCPIKWVRAQITKQYNIRYRQIEYSNKKRRKDGEP